MTPLDPPVIQALGLSKYYGRIPGIVDLDLEVGPGEVLGFLGPNGAGKTTTIRMLLGLIRPTRGTVLLFGRKAYASPGEPLHEIGYVPGEVALYPDLTGTEYLEHLLELRTERSGTGHQDRLARLKAEFPISYSRKIRTFSKGMRQTVGIIQAFMHDPRLIVMDEPTTGLDPLMRDRFLALVEEERGRGKTIFYSSHVLGEVERICDRIAIIREGRLARVASVRGSRTFMGKKVTVEVEDDPFRLMDRLRTVTGVTEPIVDGKRVRLFFNGEMRELMAGLAGAAIRDFLCEPPTLEDVFLELYGE